MVAINPSGTAVAADNSLFQKIFQHSNDAILVIHPQQERIIDANPAACEKLAYTHERLLETPLSALYPQELPRLAAFAQTVLASGHGSLEDCLCLTGTGAQLPVDISASALEIAGRSYLLLLLHDLTQRQWVDHTLRTIVAGTAAVTGAEFFQALVRNLAEALGVRYSFISEFANVKTRVRTLAYWGGEGFRPNVEFDLAGTPCEAVLRGEIRHYPDGISELFPKDKGMVDKGIRSYLAIPLADPQGDILGHLAVFDAKPMPAEHRDMSIFRIFAARATAEVLRQQAERERQAAEQALRESEQRLANLLNSAMDAVIAFDGEHHIMLFNAAAEKVFRCSAAWAKGQPFDRFLSKQFRSLLERYLKTLASAGHSHEQLWAPEGLTARRADGEEFPIETTISTAQAAGKRFYTVILRDVDERAQAEQSLRQLYLENRYLQEQLSAEQGEDIVGNAPIMRELFNRLQKVAASDTSVLLLGETGTGKEVLARAIHDFSPRKAKLLIKMNCAALPSELIESELFGHEKGAFTGATAQRKGRFELAHGGTLFLDEVGELSAPAQAKLLRALQEQEFERVGGSQPIKVDVRVIAATNRDLAAMVAAGTFRADLYYRLNVFPLRVPPLRERREDIPVLARQFLRKLSRKLDKRLVDLAPRALTRLQAYPWPGNIRELQNVIERAAILAASPLVEVEDALELRLEPAAADSAPLAGTLEDVERNYIAQVLEANHWVIEGAQGAAAILGLHPSTLRSRMHKLGIKRPALS